MKKALYSCFICLFVVLATGIILFYTHQPVPLGFLVRPVSKLVSYLTDSQTKIDGNYYISLGEWVVISVNNGSVVSTNKNGPILSAELERFETTIHLNSFLKRQLLLDGVSLQGAEFDLHLEEQSLIKVDLENREVGSPDHRQPFVLQDTGEIKLKGIKATVFYEKNRIPVQYQVDDGSGLFGRDTDGHLEISGVANTVALKAKITTGPNVKLYDETTPWPFSLTLFHKSIVASVSGDIRINEEKKGIEASVTLDGNNLDDLVSLFGRTGSKNKAFSVKGKVKLAERDAMAQLAVTIPGAENLVLNGLVKKGKTEDAQISLKVQGESINLDVIKGFITPPEKGNRSQKNTQGVSRLGRDNVLLPEIIPVSNLDLDLDLKHLTLAGKSIKDLTLKAIVNDGYIDEAPFSATFKNSSLTGHFTFMKEGNLPRIKSRLDSRSFDIGAFLKEYNFAEDIDLQMAEVSTDLTTKGRTLGELVDNLEFTTNSKNGIYVFEDKNTKSKLPIQLHHSTISVSPGNGIQAHLKGVVRNSPVDIAIRFTNLPNTSQGSDELSYSSLITLAGGRIELEGKIPVPIKIDGAVLNSRLSCKKLSDFNDLLDLKLPAIGPITFTGNLNVVSNGYRLQALQVDVGESSLAGRIEIDTTLDIPKLTVNLQAKTIQLDDFKFEPNQLEDQSEIVPQNTDRQREAQKAKGNKKKRRNLTDEEVLERYNATINIEVGDVFSGEDRLGSGSLSLNQQDGTLEVMPLHLNLPGGTATLSFSVDPDNATRRYTIHMKISELDYGTIGRWYQPKTDFKGTISLRSSLISTSTSFNKFMAGATGYIDFSIQPEKFRAGVIDLWAVNFLNYLALSFTPKDESVINCGAARLNLENGVMSHEDLLIDTSRIQVKGKIGVDFNKNWIEAAFVPKPKRPQFLSLATPVKISGKISKFKTGVPPGGVLGTVIRNITSYVTVPVQWIFKKKVPKNGTANCIQLFEDRTFDTQDQFMQEM